MPAANELVIYNEFDTDNWQLLNGTHTFGIDCICTIQNGEKKECCATFCFFKSQLVQYFGLNLNLWGYSWLTIMCCFGFFLSLRFFSIIFQFYVFEVKKYGWNLYNLAKGILILVLSFNSLQLNNVFLHYKLQYYLSF